MLQNYHLECCRMQSMLYLDGAEQRGAKYGLVFHRRSRTYGKESKLSFRIHAKILKQ